MPSEVSNARVFRSLEAMSGEMLGNAIVFDFKKILELYHRIIWNQRRVLKVKNGMYDRVF